MRLNTSQGRINSEHALNRFGADLKARLVTTEVPAAAQEFTS
jgi:hypothetical protein